MVVFLEPLDVWVFRDGRPFSAGEDHHAKCVFPPSPFTVQGALRSKVLTEHCGNLDKYAGRPSGACAACGPATVCPVRAEIGFGDDPGPFRLRWILPARQSNGAVTPHFPVPRHVVRAKAMGTWNWLRPIEDAHLTNLSTGLRTLGARAPYPVEHQEGWVAAAALTTLLHGELPEGLYPVRTRGEGSIPDESRRPSERDVLEEQQESILAEEPRVGIGLTPGRKTAASGQFFVVDALRLHKGWGLAVAFDGLRRLPDSGFLDIGGEGRAARYATTSEAPYPPASAREIEQERRFLLYLMSPALFGDDSAGWTWRPGFLGDDLVGVIPDSRTRVRLVAAAIGSPVRIGGWELGTGERGGRPRPMRAAVPAGSVYFFEIADGPVEPVLALHGQTVTDRYAAFGFGVALIGRWLRWHD